jgi:hypothetical protein
LGKAVFDKIPVQPQLHLSLLLSILASETENPAEQLSYHHMETMDPHLFNSLVFLAEDKTLSNA